VFCETLDFLHTSLARMVAHRQGGIDGMLQVLSAPPVFWARDYFSPGKDLSAPAGRAGKAPVRLPVVR
jgi:hypothetical protein